MADAASARVIGSLPGGGWVGIAPAGPAGHLLLFGMGRHVRRESASRALRVAAAIAYFEESLADAPGLGEATQADVARLVESLHRGARSPAELARLRQASDAVDDGLPGEVVAMHLREALAALKPGQQAEPVDLLVGASGARHAAGRRRNG